MNRTIVFSLLLILLSAWSGWGATYYVKNGGDDSLAGTSDATAWATIAKVQATVMSGDTVYFRSQDTWSVATLPAVIAKAGVTYDGATYGSGTRAKINVTGGYTIGNSNGVVNIYSSNVTFKGFEIDGNANVTGGIYIGTHAVANISTITVDNCIVHDTGYNDSSGTDWNYGIHIGPENGDITVSNVAVTNTQVYNTAHEGIAIYPGWGHPNNKNDTVLVRNCTIYGTGKFVPGWGNGIYLVNNSDNVTIEYNTIHTNGSNGIASGTSNYDGMGSMNNLTVRYNLIYENRGSGILVNFCSPTDAWAADGAFYGNLILDSGYGAGETDWSADIMLDNSTAGTGTYGTSTFSFYNNTSYNTENTAAGKAGVVVGEWTALGGTPTINFKNNIVYTISFTPLLDIKNLLTHSNNLIFRTSSASDEHVNNGTSYNRAGVTTWEASAQNTSPTFTGGTLPSGFSGTYGTNMVPNTNYFAISSGGAIDKGATLGSPYDGCINGAGLAIPLLRPAGAYDIGAYNYVTVIGPTSLAAPTNLRIVSP